MSWIMTGGLVLVLSTVLGILGMWHRSVQKAEDERIAEEARAAEQEGSNRALTQHPQIDVSRCLGCGSCVSACPEHGVLAMVNRKARLVRASLCVGHAACEAACPVGALRVGLGDLSARTDIPVLTPERETTVPGVFIAGELSGIGLIRNAVLQGTEVINTIAGRLKDGHQRITDMDVVDVVIVGSGPAGIAATLRAHELGLQHVVIDQDDLGGTVRKYPRNKMTLTQPVDLPLYGRMKLTQYSKEALIDLWETVFRDRGITVRSGVRFTGLSPRPDGALSIETSQGTILGRHCVLALGRRGTPRKLGVPGEESERVLYQLLDAAEYQHQNLLVVGGGDSAIESALALASQPGNTVTLSYRRNAFFRIKPRNRQGLETACSEGRIKLMLNSNVKAIEPDTVQLSVSADDDAGSELKQIAADRVLVLAGGEPPYPLLQRIGIAFGGGHHPASTSLKEAC